MGTESNYPFITRDGSRLYFCSDRSSGGTEDIYYSDKIGNMWGKLVRLNSNINTRSAEISPSVTADGQTLYFCRYTTSGKWDIYYSVWCDSTWSKPVNIGAPINTPAGMGVPANEQTACISAGGDTLVFTGPHYWETMYPPDLMYSIKTDTGWSYPQLFFSEYEGNKSREYEPWISANGKILFFQTAYHVDWERDIFYSFYNGEHWNLPKNIGSPVNTEQAEMNPSLSPDGNTLYFARIYNTGEHREGDNIWVSHRLIDGVDQKAIQPLGVSLFSAYPNPFNSSVNIVSNSENYGIVELQIINLLGKEVKTIRNNFGQTGPDTIRWDGTDQNNQPVPSGVYLCSINAKDGQSKTLKLLLLK